MDFHTTHISKKSIELINQVLESTYISAGKIADQFEQELSLKLNLSNPVTVNSGTSAIHLGLVIAGVGRGDEVILPAQTFIATGLSVLMCGAKPVFADIQYETGNICPDSIKKMITKKTKAIIPVHWAGYPCDMEEIHAIANENNITIIEDAAHAMGAIYKGRAIGSISSFTAFSFQAIKHLTTGDGGALCCRDQKDAEKAKRLRWFGIDRKNSAPSILGERAYDATELGYKYHMNDLAAAMGIGNLTDLQKILLRRQEIAKKYYEGLKNISGLSFLSYKVDRQSSFWLFTILVEKREAFIKMLQEKGIPASVVHLRIDKNSIFGGINKNLVNQERFNETQVSLPIHQKLTDEEVNLIIKTIKSGW